MRLQLCCLLHAAAAARSGFLNREKYAAVDTERAVADAGLRDRLDDQAHRAKARRRCLFVLRCPSRAPLSICNSDRRPKPRAANPAKLAPARRSRPPTR